MVCRHFAASAMSLDLTRAFDATRILTMSCMALLADTVARIKGSDTHSRFSMHLDGKGGGPFPQIPFGFDVSMSFAKQSESMLFTDPNQVAVRTKVTPLLSPPPLPLTSQPQTLNPKPSTLIPKPEILNPKP